MIVVILATTKNGFKPTTTIFLAVKHISHRITFERSPSLGEKVILYKRHRLLLI